MNSAVACPRLFLICILVGDDLPDEINQSVYKENQRESIAATGEGIKSDIESLLSDNPEKAKELQLDTMWLSVYIKNKRAIRFYERNAFKNYDPENFE